MSAIIAGKSCSVCGKEHYVSIGHPKWYDAVVLKKHNPTKEDEKEFERFRKIQKSGMCVNCIIKRDGYFLSKPKRTPWIK